MTEMETPTVEHAESIATLEPDAEGTTMKTCVSCGETRNPEDARFCASCGTPLVGTASAPPDDPPAEPVAEPTTPAPFTALETGDLPPFDRPDQPAYQQLDRPSTESRYWAVAAHASSLVGGFMGGLPAFIGPLVVWLVRKDEDAWSAGHGRDALNFNLSVLAYAVALLLIAIVTLGVGLLIAIPGWIFLALGWFALTLVGAIKAATDQPWRYPLTIRFVK
jgi:uncharacterized Tic20 family protein